MVRVVSYLEQVVQKLSRDLEKEARVAGNQFLRFFDEGLTGPHSGTIYGRAAARRKAARKGATRGTGAHQASAPNEAPAIWTGALRKSAMMVLIRDSPIRFRVQIGVSFEGGRGSPQSGDRSIADMLEFGTIRMAPRPGWRLALKKWLPWAQSRRWGS